MLTLTLRCIPQNATLAQAAKDLLKSTSKVIVAGSDGGGNLLYITADRIRSVPVTAAGIAEANFAVIPIEGFWLNWQGCTSGFSLQQAIVGRNDARGATPTARDPDKLKQLCATAQNTSECGGLKGCGKWSQPVNRTTGRPIDTAQGSCSPAQDFQVAGGNAWKFMNVQGAMNPACVAAIDPAGTRPSEHWKCLLAEVAGRHIKSRIFPLE